MHEQYGPRDLLDQAVAGERAGFDGIDCSDHFQPWWDAAKRVSDDDFKEKFIVSSDPEQHAGRIRELERVAGDVDLVVKLSNQSGPNALEAIRVYGEEILPALRGGAP
jgi:alkanesulfonate monooxygenase SsuD/methylene tetrahydromethanopterin reductase-like flavin-dependent oxidoreductase (luciferase family)